MVSDKLFVMIIFDFVMVIEDAYFGDLLKGVLEWNLKFSVCSISQVEFEDDANNFVA